MRADLNRSMDFIAQAFACLSLASAASAQAAVVSYEAENGTVGGGANVQSATNASGGRIVGHIVDVGAHLQMNVDGGTGGAATLTVRSANAYATASALSLYVNGVRQRQLSFPTTGSWNTFVDLAAVTVTLAAGNNTIRLQHDAGDVASADIDRVVVNATASPPPPPPPLRRTPSAAPAAGRHGEEL